MSNAAGAQGTRGRRLVLHFDIRNTCLMKDYSQEVNSVQMSVARIICKSAWGKLNPAVETDHNDIPSWQLAYDQLSWDKPDALVKDKDTGEPINLVSYLDWLTEFYPANKSEQNKAIQADRILSFATQSGPGSKLRKHFDKMMKALTLPKGAKEELNYPQTVVDKVLQGQALWDDAAQNLLAEGEENEDGVKKLTEDQKLLLTMFGEGKYHLIPSFFRTLIFLKKQKREFAVVFRTFEEDLANVKWEFNQFASGLHPCYSGRNGTPHVKFDGSKGTKNFRFRDLTQSCSYYRFSHELSDAKLVMGTNDRLGDDLNKVTDGLLEDQYEDCEMVQEHMKQYLNILETFKKFSAMTISEHLHAWKDNDYHREAAKLLLIDQADYGTQHIFFDDQAHADEDCIVDVRDAITQEVVPYNKFIGQYVVKVEPHRAILESDYFIKMIEEAEQARDEEIEKCEAGVPEPVEGEAEEEEQKAEEDGNEWDKLQRASNEEYLMKTVLPVLYQGMKIIDQQRPEAPLDYLALYLLKHQDQIKLPTKPQDVNDS